MNRRGRADRVSLSLLALTHNDQKQRRTRGNPKREVKCVGSAHAATPVRGDDPQIERSSSCVGFPTLLYAKMTAPTR
jgi:hypothetical protein